MSTVELIFEDPPAPKSGRTLDNQRWDIPTWCALLRRHPGRWARHPNAASSVAAITNTATRIRKGQIPGTLPGEFEATVRVVDGGVALYARYVGGES